MRTDLRRGVCPRTSVVALALVLAFPSVASAQSALQLTTDDGSVRPRVSDNLLEHPGGPKTYAPGTIVAIPSEEDPAAATRSAVLLHLAALPVSSARQKEDRASFTHWLDGLPITGRTIVDSADARWLQAHQSSDPFLPIGAHVYPAARPTTVTVVLEDGRQCKIAHTPGYEVKSYLAACFEKTAMPSGDVAWMAEPDGQTFRFGIARWNEQSQNQPAPGAWIWAPSSSSGWSGPMSDKLIAFLATQGAAADVPPSAAKDALITAAIAPDAQLTRDRDLPNVAGDWGGSGVLQTATARMAPTGDMAASIERASPYTRINVIFQPFDWLEAGFRYTDISNQRYGPASLSGSQSYKDKSVDVKVRLHSETAATPAVAVGMRDIAGTGLFSGEYLVASKHAGDFDFSGGLGWGYVGGRGDIHNPFSIFGSKFNTRSSSATGSDTGEFNPQEFFHGPAAFFGGVQYHTPWDPLVVKVEYDGNNYQHEPFGNKLSQNTPINVGVTYRYSKNVDLTVGVERGNTAMAGVTFHGSLPDMGTSKTSDPRRIPISARAPFVQPDWSITAHDLEVQTGWKVERIQMDGNDVRVVFENVNTVYWLDRVNKAMTVLHRDAPANVQRFRLSYVEYGIPMAEHLVYRDDWVATHIALVPPSQRRNPVAVMPPLPAPASEPVYEKAPARFTGGAGLAFQETVGGPDGFLLYNVAASYDAEYRLDAKTWASGSVTLRLLDNYDRFTYDAESNLPRVRTYIREYLTTSRFNMQNAQVTHIGNLSNTQYWSVYGGYLESMFGGVGAEYLYRPMGSAVAFGADANWVKQRSFDEDFGFRDYHVLTGHATFYWDTGWQDVLAKVSGGQYLAGDRGATVDLSRRFRNGVTLGAYATKTNVSAAQFGEGSFDKGIYLTIPFDAMLTRSSSYVGSFVYDPLVRDGGAQLQRQFQLYDMTRARDPRTLDYTPTVP